MTTTLQQFGPISATTAGIADRAWSPWRSIWLRPRDTIAGVVRHNPRHHVLLLAMAAGIADLLHRLSGRLPMTLLLAVGLGALAGALLLYLKAWLLRRTGHWLGGRASAEHLRAAIAWSSLPNVVTLVLWVPALAVFGSELFATEMPCLLESPRLLVVFAGLAALHAIMGIWSFVLYLHCVGEVQGFSVWKALLNTALMLALAAGALLVPAGLVLLGSATVKGFGLPLAV